MHLLYLDDSGSAKNQDEEYLVLGGISVYEAQAPWVSQELDKLAEAYSTDPNSIEFHASDIFQGRSEPWKSMDKTPRKKVVSDVLSILQRSYDTATVFACAVHKKSYPNHDAMELAFEDLCSRFSRYLNRLTPPGGQRERGLIVIDESSYETSLQRLAVDFRTLGTRWGVIQNLVETPLFVDSKASRCIQLADHIAYSTFRRYEQGDTYFFDRIVNKFDQVDGKLHGLAHKQLTNQNCMCPACMSRRVAG